MTKRVGEVPTLRIKEEMEKENREIGDDGKFYP
jgi:hypothetical protein